jgi:hypothetical protein
MTKPQQETACFIPGLVQQLKGRRAKFDSETSADGQRHQAALMISDIVVALQRLPDLSDLDLSPLKNTLMMFNDLEGGRAHPWSTPTNFGGTNRQTSAGMEMRLWVTMAQLVLIPVLSSGRAADKVVQAHLAATGRTYSLKTLEKWRKEFNDRHDARLRHVDKLLAEHWDSVRCKHGSNPLHCTTVDGEPCPDGKRLALAFAEWAIRTPSFQDRLPSAYRK